MSSLDFCKICRGPVLRGINERLRNGDTLPSIVDWCAGWGFKVTRQKIAHHRDAHGTRDPASDRHVTSCCCGRLRQELLRVLAQ